MAIQSIDMMCCIIGANFINGYDKENWLISNGRDYTNHVIASYATLRSIFFDIGRRSSTCTLQALYEALGGKNGNYNKNMAINKSIELLCANNYIKLWEAYDTTIEVDFKELASTDCFKVEFLFEDEEAKFIGEGGFVKVPEQNMDVLLRYIRNTKGNLHAFQLIRYYLIIARLCSNDSLIGYISQEKIRKLYGFSHKTCQKYNEILVSLGLIVYNSNYRRYNQDSGKFLAGCIFFGHKNIYNKEGKELTEERWIDIVTQLAYKNKYKVFTQIEEGTKN